MVEALDPRLTPARNDVAARHLQGKVVARRFADGVVHEVVAAVAPVRNAPSHDATQLTQALRGEHVTLYDIAEDWGWGQLKDDGYVGYLPLSALAMTTAEPTHKVVALSTLAFPGPSIKLPPAVSLPLGSRLAIAKSESTFAITPEGWHIPARHLATLDHYESDAVAIAERFLGAPYLWGGKTSIGLDCSGLVQVALNACGIACPRDSDMQENALGAALPRDAKLKRGDLIFWKGHVAIARDEMTMIHANAFHMSVAIEPIKDGIARIAASGSDVTSIKRI
jgi:cell wall-associated NlpC family hydrolase